MLDILWLLCCVLCYGLLFATFQRGNPQDAKQHYKWDMAAALCTSLYGPYSLLGALIIVFAIRKYHGFKFA